MRAFFKTMMVLPALLIAAACGGGGGGVATCSTSNDCGAGQTCVNGICTVGASDAGGAQPGALGAACAARSDCSGNLSCIPAASGFPNGYCSAACGSTSCPAGSECADLTDTTLRAMACMNSCTSASECRSGYVCCAAFGKACTPAADCPASSGGGSGGGSAGGSGGGSAGGSGGGSAGGSGGGSAGGSGGGSAGGSGGGSGGGSPATCGTPTILTGTGSFPSAKPTSCLTPVIAPPSSGYASGANVQHLGTHAVGDNVNFTVGSGVGSITIIAQNTKTVTADPTYTFTQQGQNYTLDNGVLPTALTTPSGDDWFDDNEYPNLPDGGPNMDPTTYHAQYGTLNLLPEATTSALTIPNTAQGIQDSIAGYPTGSWSFQVSDDDFECASGEFTDPSQQVSCSGGSDAGTYDISVVTKPATSATGTVDIAIYLASSVVTAAAAPTNTHVKRFVSTIAGIYANLGICINSVTFYDLPAWAKTAYGGATTSGGGLASGAGAIDVTKTSTCDNLDQMFTLAQPANTLNFFFVDSIIDDGAEPTGGEEVVGIDGAIPAPSGFSGTVHTGAVVNASDILLGTCGSATSFTSCGADETAYITAHEGGHWMGLYHTSEATGANWDPLTDTPTCGCTTACGISSSALACCIDPTTQNFIGSCSSQTPTEVEGTDCTKNTSTCGGGDYLMFWILDTPSLGTVSQQQGQIARSNLVVH